MIFQALYVSSISPICVYYYNMGTKLTIWSTGTFWARGTKIGLILHDFCLVLIESLKHTKDGASHIKFWSNKYKLSIPEYGA